MPFKKRVLFVCIHNSGRSQMAEAFLKTLAGDRFEVKSAGLEPGKLNPYVVRAMAEAGINILYNRTKSIQQFLQGKKTFDYVITVCDEASAERCPTFPGKAQRLHWGFPDPAQVQGTEEEKLEKVKIIRDQIRHKIELWLKSVS